MAGVQGMVDCGSGCKMYRLEPLVPGWRDICLTQVDRMIGQNERWMGSAGSEGPE